MFAVLMPLLLRKKSLFAKESSHRSKLQVPPTWREWKSGTTKPWKLVHPNRDQADVGWAQLSAAACAAASNSAVLWMCVENLSAGVLTQDWLPLLALPRGQQKGTSSLGFKGIVHCTPMSKTRWPTSRVSAQLFLLKSHPQPWSEWHGINSAKNSHSFLCNQDKL